jgi:tetratricopeptide (TPR) repeat protein/class 3 adenylate cyclase
MKNLIPRFILEKYKENKFSGNFKATTMFIDISGFTAMTQNLMKNGKEGAEILSNIINEIYTPSIKAVYDNNGFISTFAGDAFTSIFPYKDSNPIFALCAAQQIQKTFNKIGKQKTKFGEFDLLVKIGLSYGKVDWGIIKSDKLNTYYFKGNAIDNCAECEQNATKGEIIFDGEFYRKLIKKNINLEVMNKEKNFYQFLNSDYIKKQTTTLYKRKNISQKDFTPEQIMKLKIKGEFRDIISCFISFEENKNWKQAISKIMNLTQTYGGYFNKIDFGDKGGNILVLFGAPVGKEKIYSRACGFASAVRNSANIKTRSGLTYGIIFAGFVGSKLREEYTALGMVVNLSARFMMKAGFGDIYIDKSINKNIQKKYETNAFAKQQFKGFKEIKQVYTLEKKIEHKFVYEGKIIGRQKELQKLKRTLKQIQSGKFGGIVYVHGIAGIGKSRLVNELKNNIILSGVEEYKTNYHWFYLPCDEILRKSFNPFTHFLKGYFEQSEENTKQINKSKFENKLGSIIKQTKDREIKSELIRTKSILGAMINLNWQDSLYEQLNAKGRFENTLYAVKNLIKAESLQKPVIIELEDGHWIDSDSKKLLKVLTTNIKKYPMIIISACRLKDIGSQFNFDLKEVPQKNIILEHLEKESSRKMIENKLNGNISEKLFNVIWQKSEGNPFYIEQVVLYLLENELIDDKLNLKKKDIEIPKTINSIIVARIDRLAAELKDLVQTASVLGREFAVNILSAMLKKSTISNELAEGEKENIWNALTEINYIFKHALIRETVYEMQLKKQLRKLHKLAAETIENLHKEGLKEFYGELANHYEKTGIKNKTIEFLQKAGDYAGENYENEQSIAFNNRLLAQKICTSLRIDTLQKKGNILQLIGEWQEAADIFLIALKFAEEIQDMKRIAKANNSLGIHFGRKGNYEKAIEYYEKDLEISKRLRDEKGISRAVGNIGVIYKDQGDYNKALKYIEKQLQISEKLDFNIGITSAAGNMGSLYSSKGNYGKAMECYKKSLKISKQFGDKNVIPTIISNIGNLYYFQGNYEKAVELNEKALILYKEVGDKQGISRIISNIGIFYGTQGDSYRAMECFTKSLKNCEELSDKPGISRALLQIGLFHIRQGNYKNAIKHLMKSLNLSEEIGDKAGVSGTIQYIGSIYRDQGIYKKAMKCFEKGLIINEEIGNKLGTLDAHMNIGVNYFNQGILKKAMESLKKSLKISEEIGSKPKISLAIGNMGGVYHKQGNYRKALELFKKKLIISKDLGDKRQISVAIGNIGSNYYIQGKFRKAMEYFNKNLIISKELGDKRGISISYGEMANIYTVQSHFEEAIQYYDSALQISEEIAAKPLEMEQISDKVKCLYLMQEFHKAKHCNENCYILAKRLNSVMYIFISKTLNEKINFKLSHNVQVKLKCIENLKALLKKEKEEENIATMNYEIAVMLNDLQKENSEYKNQAVSIFKKLYKKMPKIEYKNKYEELEKL